MLNNKNLVPSYVEADFLSALTKNTELLRASDTFKDYNYHGANFTMILELLSYLADFSSFHTNMVAQNVYMDSANIYETVHSLAQQKGYNARGWVSPWLTTTVELTGSFNVGDQIYVSPWQMIDTGFTAETGEQIYYTITDDYTYTVPTPDGYDSMSPEDQAEALTNPITLITFDIHMRQGVIEELKYDGEDLIDNNIILPFHNYDYGTYPFTIPAVNVWINDEKWQRTNDFYDKLSGLQDLFGDSDDVFMLKYDKYRRYMIQFNSSRNVPRISDEITVNLLVSLGSFGGLQERALDANMARQADLVIHNITRDEQIPVENILTFTNFEPSIGGSDPEDIEEIKTGARSNTHSQYRNITSKDYRYHLEARSDVVRGLAWGEQEIDPGNILEYNKTYLSVIPEAGNGSLFALGTINTEIRDWSWTDSLGQTISTPIEVASSYVNDFRNSLLQYLEPRKMLNNYEIPVLPDIVYFRFDIGLRVRRTFNYRQVMEDVRDKLAYFFKPSNRLFHEEISFMDIHNFILDNSITSESSEFKYIPGIENLVFRDIGTYTTFNIGEEQIIFEPSDNRYPMYKYPELQDHFDNKFRPVLLYYNQFPMLVASMCRFFREI